MSNFGCDVYGCLCGDDLAELGAALQRCVELIEAELEPTDSEPSGVSAGVDWVRSVLKDARAALGAYPDTSVEGGL